MQNIFWQWADPNGGGDTLGGDGPTVVERTLEGDGPSAAVKRALSEELTPSVERVLSEKLVSVVGDLRGPGSCGQFSSVRQPTVQFVLTIIPP